MNPTPPGTNKGPEARPAIGRQARRGAHPADGSMVEMNWEGPKPGREIEAPPCPLPTLLQLQRR